MRALTFFALLLWGLPAYAQTVVGPCLNNGPSCIISGSITAGSIAAASGQSLNIITGGASQSVNIGNGPAGLGQVLNVTTNSGGNANDGATGNKVQVNNLFQANFYRSPGNSYTLSGSAIPYVMNLSSAIAGTSTAGSDGFYKIGISTDTASTSSQLAGLLTFYNFGGAGFSGSRSGFQSIVTQTGSAGTSASINGASSWVFVQNFTNTLAKYYGFGAQVNVAPNVTGLYGVFGGGEYNVKVQSGASLEFKGIMTLINQTGDTVQGSLYDAALGISSQPNTVASGTVVGWDRGIVFGRYDGQWPTTTTGTLIGTYQEITNSFDSTVALKRAQSAYGVDFQFPYFTGAAFRSTGFTVNGGGSLQIGPGAITIANSGLTIDTPGQSGASVAVSAAGNSCQVGEEVTDGIGGKYQISTINGGGGITGLSTLNEAYSTSPPSNPINVTGGHCSGASVNITWTSGTTLNIGTGTATTIGIGNSGSTTTITGTIKAGSGTGQSQTCTVNTASALTLIFTNGILTGGTCNS